MYRIQKRAEVGGRKEILITRLIEEKPEKK